MNFNRFSLFKLPNRHKSFEYVPRYYDPKKEALKKKIQQAKKENLVDENGKYAREISFRQKTEDRWGNSDYKAQHLKANIRLAIILSVIIFAFYFLFKGLDIVGPVLDSLKK